MKLSSREIDAIKGILILCIILGHNTLITSSIGGEFRLQLYNFHVGCFLLLPFIYIPKFLNMELVKSMSTRYLVPYVFFYLFASLLYTILLADRSPLESIFAIIVGLFVSSAKTLDDACGFQLYWFLPALLSLVLLRAASYSLMGSSKYFIIFAALSIHVSVGGFSSSMKDYFPFGLLIALFIFPLGLLVEWVWARCDAHNIHTIMCSALVIWLGCVIVTFQMGSGINIGTLDLIPANDFIALLIHDLYLLSAFISILCFSRYLLYVPVLALLGRHSLIIYLSHSLAFQAFLWIFNLNIESGLWATSILSLLFTISGALLCSIFIVSNQFLHQLIVPVSHHEWLITRKL